MYSDIYEITDHVYEIRSLYGDIHTLCRDYRSDKRAETVITTDSADIEYERGKAVREAEFAGNIYKELPDGYLETLAVYRKIATHAVSRGMFLFHCSAVSAFGSAYAFTAKSGTGKSTHTALWRRVFGDDAFIINDDKPIIGINENGATVYGTPWNGKHGLGRNVAVPLKAICFLSRGAENRIKPVTDKGIIIPKLLNQTFRPSDAVALKRTLELLDRLCSRVSFYSLECNMEEEAARVSFRGMSE